MVVVMDKDVEALKKFKAELPPITTVQVDLLDWEATRIEMEKIGPFDHLINNAGVANIADFMDIKEEDVDLYASTP